MCMVTWCCKEKLQTFKVRNIKCKDLTLIYQSGWKFNIAATTIKTSEAIAANEMARNLTVKYMPMF